MDFVFLFLIEIENKDANSKLKRNLFIREIGIHLNQSHILNVERDKSKRKNLIFFRCPNAVQVINIDILEMKRMNYVMVFALTVTQQ